MWERIPPIRASGRRLFCSGSWVFRLLWLLWLLWLLRILRLLRLQKPRCQRRGLVMMTQITPCIGSIFCLTNEVIPQRCCLQGPPLPCYPNGLFLSRGRCEWCNPAPWTFRSSPAKTGLSTALEKEFQAQNTNPDQETVLESLGSLGKNLSKCSNFCHEVTVWPSKSRHLPGCFGLVPRPPAVRYSVTATCGIIYTLPMEVGVF